MAKELIYSVEDEEDILELITYNLAKEGYVVKGFTTAEEALQKSREKAPDAFLLDLMLPGMDGLDFCKEVRQLPNNKNVPIIILTAKGEESNIVTGLELGADDYIVKPFSPRILIARLRAVLRRGKSKTVEEHRIIKIHNLEINPGRYEVFIDGVQKTLTTSEFKALQFLASRPGWVFTRYQIVEAVHGSNYPVTDRSVDVLIVGLRKKLHTAGNYIETIRGIGYRFKE